MIYGYCRISTPRQNLERQVRNIRTAYPDAVIIREVYTGTKIYERPEFDRLLRKVSDGDTLVFDSVSRMSRTSQEGYKIYQDLYNQGVSLIFLKEPHINTSTYQQALDSQFDVKIKTGDPISDELMSGILNAVNRYILNLARKQIQLAFEQAEKEVTDLHQRTREGIERQMEYLRNQLAFSNLLLREAVPGLVAKYARNSKISENRGTVIDGCRYTVSDTED